MSQPGDVGSKPFCRSGALAAIKPSRLPPIARAAGLSKANLLYYYPSKDALYLAVLEQGLALWLQPFGRFTVEDLIADVLAPMARAGLIEEVIVKTRSLYQITSAGRIALLAPEDEKPLEVVPPRERPFVSWDGRMQWDTASERGCHRGIGSVGVAC